VVTGFTFDLSMLDLYPITRPVSITSCNSPSILFVMPPVVPVCNPVFLKEQYGYVPVGFHGVLFHTQCISIVDGSRHTSGVEQMF